ncbi:fructosamine kinase family protein [Candidatus Sumerlaeota bacterium]|nr:fructosamine kinase family protein [Candidatus Sumerlaeota bacterium]
MYPSLRLAVERALTQKLNGQSNIVESKPGGGGCINNGMMIRLTSGQRYFLKFNPKAPEGLFESEAEGLVAIRRTGVVRAPEPIAFGSGTETGEPNAPPFLVLEWIESGSPKAGTARTLGRQLAQMHEATAKQFGFESDNYIGASPQVNRWSDGWVEFFARSRLGVQSKLLERRGYATSDLQSRLEKLIEKLPNLIGGREIKPSLVHGDLWSGNFMVDETGGPVLIDPAVHYADREVDLAMTELFGRFDPEFYGGYKEVHPLDAGYEERKDIYNLYHLMNHLYLFGLSYMSGVMQTLRRFT